MIREDRIRQIFEQEEIIEMKLSGTILQIEGIGTAGSNVNQIFWLRSILTPGKFYQTFLRNEQALT